MVNPYDTGDGVAGEVIGSALAALPNSIGSSVASVLIAVLLIVLLATLTAVVWWYLCAVIQALRWLLSKARQSSTVDRA